MPIAAAISLRAGTLPQPTWEDGTPPASLFNMITTDWIRTLEGGSGLSGRSAPDWLIQAQLLALFWPLTLFLGRLLVGDWAIPMSLALPAVWTVHEFLLRRRWARSTPPVGRSTFWATRWWTIVTCCRSRTWGA